MGLMGLRSALMVMIVIHPSSLVWKDAPIAATGFSSIYHASRLSRQQQRFVLHRLYVDNVDNQFEQLLELADVIDPAQLKSLLSSKWKEEQKAKENELKAKENELKAKENELQAKDALLKKEEALTKKEEGKNELLQARFQDKEDRLLEVSADLSKLRAQYDAETNLRPLLEFYSREWAKKFRNRDKYVGSITSNFKDFSRYLSLEDKNWPTQKENEHAAKLRRAFDESMRLGQVPEQKWPEVIASFNNMYSLLSEDTHATTRSQSINATGFVANKSTVFAAAFSIYFIYHKLPHTIFSRGYVAVRYKWEP